MTRLAAVWILLVDPAKLAVKSQLLASSLRHSELEKVFYAKVTLKHCVERVVAEVGDVCLHQSDRKVTVRERAGQLAFIMSISAQHS